MSGKFQCNVAGPKGANREECDRLGDSIKNFSVKTTQKVLQEYCHYKNF